MDNQLQGRQAGLHAWHEKRGQALATRMRQIEKIEATEPLRFQASPQSMHPEPVRRRILGVVRQFGTIRHGAVPVLAFVEWWVPAIQGQSAFVLQFHGKHRSVGIRSCMREYVSVSVYQQ